MAVYQMYVNAMSEKIRQRMSINNPFVFENVSNLNSVDHFEDIGLCVVLTSPGMIQNGLNRYLPNLKKL